MMAFEIGIDPGLQGAVALVGPDGLVDVVDAPTLKTTKPSGGAKTIYDVAMMVSIVERMQRAASGEAHEAGRLTATVELVHAMPQQGVSSTFTFGEGYGLWQGILAALKVPTQLVTPQRWKKTLMTDGPKTDQAVVAYAGRVFPGEAPRFRGPRGALLLGRADAAMIAWYGWSNPRA